MFVILCLSVCFRNVGCWHVPVLGPVAFAQGSKKKKKKLIKKEVPPGGGHPLHLGWLNPAITSSVGDSTVQFLVVGTCVRARPLLTVQCHTLCIQSC